MNDDMTVDPAWIEWAEQETVRRLRGEKLSAPDAPEPLETVPPAPAPAPDEDPIRVIYEIRLDSDDAPPPAEIRLATRADGTVIRIHRENVSS